MDGCDAMATRHISSEVSPRSKKEHTKPYEVRYSSILLQLDNELLEEHQNGEDAEEVVINDSHRIASKQFPSNTKQEQPTKSDVLTSVLVSILELRVIDILPALGFLFLTYNVIEALYKASGDCKTISFVVCSYSILIALFSCLKSFEKLPEDDESTPKKTRLKVNIWILATLLNISFSYRVTSILDSVIMSSFVWTLAVVTTVGSFCGLFVLPDDKTQSNLIDTV